MSKFPFSALIGPKVRTVDVEGKTYFVAKDFCQSIGLKDHKKSTANFYEEDTMYWKVPTNGGVQDMIVISPKACLMLIFKKVLRAGCDEESVVFHVGEELLEGLLAGAAS